MLVALRAFLVCALVGGCATPSFAVQSYAERVREHRLANGLQVLLLEDHKAPVAVVQVWYRVGSRDERPGLTGLAHVLEHMMFKGTKTLGPEEYSRTIKQNGGDENAFTTADATAYYAKLASDRIDVALRLEADRMVNLAFATEQFTPELAVVMEERRLRTADQPIAEMFEQMNAAAYVAHPYQSPVIGWMNDLRQLTREDALEFYKLHYGPANAVLVVVGDFASDAVLQQIETHFGPLSGGTTAPVVRAVEPPQEGERSIRLERPAELSFVGIAYHVPNLTHPDAAALEVMATLLAGGKSARLHNDLVYERRLARSTGASYDMTSVDPGLFYVYAQPLPDGDVEQLRDALLRHVEQMRTQPVRADELARAKSTLEAGSIFAQDSLFNQAMLLGEYELGGDWRRIDDYLPSIQAVTAEDVRRVAQRYFSATNRTVGILAPQ